MGQPPAVIPCWGPGHELWSLVLHPSALIIEPPQINGQKRSNGTSLCAAIWRVTAKPSVSDSLLLKLRICAGPQKTSPQKNSGLTRSASGEQRAGERLLPIRFQDSTGRSLALAHLRERRAAELKSLVGQVASFAQLAATSAQQDALRINKLMQRQQLATSFRVDDAEMCQRSTSSVQQFSGFCGRDAYSP